jgi:hypothetical protein
MITLRVSLLILLGFGIVLFRCKSLKENIFRYIMVVRGVRNFVDFELPLIIVLLSLYLLICTC